MALVEDRLDETNPAAGTVTGTRRRPRRSAALWGLFLGLAAAVVAADQVSKAVVDAGFQLAWTRAPVPGLAEPTPVIGDLVRIAKTYNTGGIFGLFGDAAILLALASLAVIALIVVYQARQGLRSHPLLTVALGILLGGAIGNLIDRLRFGRVVDFVDVGIGELRFYTFNVADSAISIAILLLLLISLFGTRLEPGSTERTVAEGSAAGPSGNKPSNPAEPAMPDR